MNKLIHPLFLLLLCAFHSAGQNKQSQLENAKAESFVLAGEEAAQHQDIVLRNSNGMQLRVVEENTQPTLRIVLPGHRTSDRTIEVIFPEHVTVRERGSTDAYQLYLFQPGQS